MSKFHFDPPPEIYEIDAQRWFKDGDHLAVRKIYGAGDMVDGLCGHRSHEHGLISTPEGTKGVCPGDWIVTYSDGRTDRWRNELFNARFKPGPSPFRAAGQLKR